MQPGILLNGWKPKAFTTMYFAQDRAALGYAFEYSAYQSVLQSS